MLTRNSSLLAQLSEDHGTLYQCPGEQQPISKAVHLGRLAAGHAACEQCAWRFQTVDEQSEEILAVGDRRPRIRRTTFGVRGAYINAIDRNIASQLTTVLSSYLQRLSNDPKLTVAIGYGGQRGAPDIFAGAVSATLQSGCNVLDAGRCSAASLQHCLNTKTGAKYGMLVTGAGGGPSEIGIDVICSDGRPIAIPWADYGISVASMKCRSENDLSPRPGNDERPPIVTESILQLPSNSAQFTPRPGRRSGELSTIAVTDTYRQWLSRWWPEECSASVLVTVTDDFTAAQLEWMQQKMDGCFAVQRSTQTPSVQPGTNPPFTIEISEDDRHIAVTSTRRKRISAERLAHWINTSHRTTAQHITAHVTADGTQLQLCDVASPDSGDAQDVTCDGLAIAGLIVTLSQHNSLPS